MAQAHRDDSVGILARQWVANSPRRAPQILPRGLRKDARELSSRQVFGLLNLNMRKPLPTCAVAGKPRRSLTCSTGPRRSTSLKFHVRFIRLIQRFPHLTICTPSICV